MANLDKSGVRGVFVVGDGKKLFGVITDGDIRRALLSGKDLQTKVGEIMNTNMVTSTRQTPADQILDKMIKNGIQLIPIVDDKNVIVDVVLLQDLKTIPLSNPDITRKEIDLINQVLSTSTLSIGPRIKEFEQKVADYIGVKHAIAVNSGTSGLHLCVRSLGIKDGDEVITTPFSFIASANCVIFERAIPVFVDIDPRTLCIDPEKIEEKITSKTKAILPVHVFGHPCDMEKIMFIAKKHNLAVIEDACEAIGAEYKNKKVGSFGDCAVMAFYPNKQITTAEGGMVLTDNDNIACLCRSMRNQGRSDGGAWLSHTMLGYNYRMSELSAALGVAQIGRIGEILEKRENVARRYSDRLKNMKCVRIPYVSIDTKMSWFVYVIKLDDKLFSREQRDTVIKRLAVEGISCNNYFPAIHMEPFYAKLFSYRENDFPITEKVSGSTIALPFYNNLAGDDIDYVCDNLGKILCSAR
jgi:Predicted pyridoxal phosphate-dependent enzyme apparently involved in regulation of cell wall biogenesis